MSQPGVPLVLKQGHSRSDLFLARLLSSGAHVRAHQIRRQPHVQPSSFKAMPEFQILVMWEILPPVNCIT